MARGELVPDEVVVAIVSDRIDEPDARTASSSMASRERCRRRTRSTGCSGRRASSSTRDRAQVTKASCSAHRERIADMKARGELCARR